jgi:hypothetical protein
VFKDEPRHLDLTPEDAVTQPTLDELIEEINYSGKS